MNTRSFFRSLSLLAVGTLSLTGCSRPWRVGPVGRSRPDAGLIGSLPERVTPGGHCESSALLNALLFLGYPVDEETIAGGGGALSFTFVPGTFPFVGARNVDMREVFFAGSGIGHTVGTAPDWEAIYALLGTGHPVSLRVDMRFLPYRYGGKYGPARMSFGGHWITLFAVDATRETAFVSDTEFPEPREIALGDLHRARTSTTKVFPPNAEYCWSEPAPRGFLLDWDRLAESSLRTVVGNYESGALEGLSRYGEELASLEERGAKSFLLPAIFAYMAGNIEDYGTGGASFRILYRGFLAKAAERSGLGGIAGALPEIDGCVESWHDLSREFLSLSGRVRGMKAAERAAEYARIKSLADGLYAREKALYTGLAAIVAGWPKVAPAEPAAGR